MSDENCMLRNLRQLTAVCTILLFATALYGQDIIDWQPLRSSNRDFRVTIPGKFLINSEGDRTEITVSTATLRISINKRRNVWGKNYAQTIKFSEGENLTRQSFEVGKFVGQRLIHSTPKRYSVSIYASSPKNYYSVNLSTSLENDPDFKRLLSSLRLDEESLFTVEGYGSPTPLDSAALVIDDLPSSPIVREFVKKPTNKDVIVKYEQIEKKIAIDSDEGNKYSRTVIILRKPYAKYTDSARYDGIEGTIRARVKLLENGQVGEIVVDPTLDKSLARNVAEAAKGIKFIPAEIDGKPVSATITFEYSFDIY